MFKKIVVIGPESTGKSTLCNQLADHFNGDWCPEYAREYLEENGMDYTFESLLTIAKGQWQLENQHTKKAPGLLFVDTDQYVMKVWCEYVFNQCHSWILKQIIDQRNELYLLCKPDLPWAFDPLREYPGDRPRQELYHIYRDLLINQNTRWVEISGDYDVRLRIAVEAVKQL